MPPTKTTILVVHDQADLTESAATLLESAGYEVLLAPDGTAACQIGREHQGSLELLLTNVSTPDTDGFTLAARLLNSRPGLRVLYVSARATDSVLTVRPGLHHWNVPFLSAPLRERELLRKVREALRLPVGAELTAFALLLARTGAVAQPLPRTCPPGARVRPTRFSLSLNLQYRTVRNNTWLPATTQTLSRSGLLLSAPAALRPGRPIDLVLELPAMASDGPRLLRCHGVIVREWPASATQAQPTMAAAVGEYSLHRADALGRRAAVTLGRWL